ncbi:YggT family protein [Gammaproteobacteria bacterium]|nr:YggT family protein [Gammaproteobacteria bacterium]
MSEATFYLFKALLDVFTVGVVLNFLFRLFKVDYFNPIVQGIVRAVDYPSQFLRSFLRPIHGIDFATLIVAVLIQSAAFYLAVVAGSITYDPVKITIWSLYSVIILCLKVSFWLMLGGILISWVARDNNHPAIKLLMQMADSIFAPFRYILPPAGGIDFSPILAFIALRYLESVFTSFASASGMPYWLSIAF